MMYMARFPVPCVLHFLSAAPRLDLCVGRGLSLAEDPLDVASLTLCHVPTLAPLDDLNRLAHTCFPSWFVGFSFPVSDYIINILHIDT